MGKEPGFRGEKKKPISSCRPCRPGGGEKKWVPGSLQTNQWESDRFGAESHRLLKIIPAPILLAYGSEFGIIVRVAVFT